MVALARPWKPGEPLRRSAPPRHIVNKRRSGILSHRLQHYDIQATRRIVSVHDPGMSATKPRVDGCAQAAKCDDAVDLSRAATAALARWCPSQNPMTLLK